MFDITRGLIHLGPMDTKPTTPICIHLQKLLLGWGFPFLIELCQICYEFP
jgi:hypothetical protein